METGLKLMENHELPSSKEFPFEQKLCNTIEPRQKPRPIEIQLASRMPRRKTVLARARSNAAS